MNTRFRAVILTGISASLCSLVSCSKPEPHLGETVSVQSAPGVSVTKSDSRSLLASGGLAGSESAVIEVEAAVLGVDHNGRILTLRGLDGQVKTYPVSAEVRNLPQVKVGDMVKIQYKRSISFETREPTAEELELSGRALETGSRAAIGEMPRASVGTAGIEVVTVDSVDKAKKMVTVRDSDGRLIPVEAKYPENLNYVKAGQKVVVTNVESMVIGVERE